MAETPPIRFFIDQNVADSVGRTLRDVLATNSPDQLVASISMRFGAVLITHDADFKKMAAKAGLGQNRFKKLSRICLRCSQPEAAMRIKAALSLIEHEWSRLHDQSGERLWLEIGSSFIRCNR